MPPQVRDEPKELVTLKEEGPVVRRRFSRRDHGEVVCCLDDRIGKREFGLAPFVTTFK